MEKNNEYSIVYASDNSFAEVLAISITSLVMNNSDELINIYILDNEISSLNKERINLIVSRYDNKKIIWLPTLNIDNVLGIEVKQDRGSISQFSRLFISRLLPLNVHKVLYLDCDVIIEQNLVELFETNLDDKIIAAVLDPVGKLYRKNLGLEENAILFNSGVMLINLDKWKSHDIEQKILKFIQKNNGNISQGDQGALGAILHNDVKLLSPKFNSVTLFYDFTYDEMLKYRVPPYFYSKEEVEQGANNPVIVHFTTSFLSLRPWVEGSTHPYTQKWLEYRNLTAWKGTPLRKNNTKFYKKAYLKFYSLVPNKIGIIISSILQVYIRPFFIKCKYKIKWSKI